MLFHCAINGPLTTRAEILHLEYQVRLVRIMGHIGRRALLLYRNFAYPSTVYFCMFCFYGVVAVRRMHQTCELALSYSLSCCSCGSTRCIQREQPLQLMHGNSYTSCLYHERTREIVRYDCISVNPKLQYLPSSKGSGLDTWVIC